MRGRDERTGELFSCIDLEAWVRSNHLLPAIREIANQVLVWLQQESGRANTSFRSVGRVGLALALQRPPTIWCACPSC